MNVFLNIIMGLGLLFATLGLIALLIQFFLVGWRKDLLKFGKSFFVIGLVLILVPMAVKPIAAWMFRPPSAEELAEEATRKQQAEALEAQRAAQKALETRREAERAAASAAEDARRAAAAPKPTPKPTPVTPAAGRRVWFVPTGTAGYYVSDRGIIDGSRSFLPGEHPFRPTGKIMLVNTEPEIIIFNEDSGDAASIDAVTRDGKLTTVTVSVTWMVVPENVALFKSKMGANTRYTPIFYDIMRSAIRTVISRRNWSEASQPGSILNRDDVAREIQEEIERHTASHFRRLGFGDQSGNIIRYGEVSLRNITFQPNAS